MVDQFVDGSLNHRNLKASSRIYRRLQPDRMRLIKLHRGRGQIRCSIIVTSRKAAPPYEALSYAWGDQSDPNEIELDRVKFSVTRNLFNALLTLRYHDRNRLLWIDALAINQVDIMERSGELSKMIKTYSQAMRTVIWLGSGNDRLEREFERLRQSRTISTSVQGTVYVDFLNLPYWQRAWVYQEMRYSRDAIIQYGTVSTALQGLFENQFGKMTMLSSTNPGVEVSRRVTVPYGVGLSGMIVDLAYWLQYLCSHRECSDSKDRVFAYYGCFRPQVQALIITDYAQSLTGIAKQVISAWVIAEKNIQFLDEITRRERWNRDEDMPSWIPNIFQSRLDEYDLFDVDKFMERLPVVMQVDDEIPEGPFVKIEENGQVLHVRGIQIGTINHVQEGRKPEGFDEEVERHIRSCQGQLPILDKHVRKFIEMAADKDRLVQLFSFEGNETIVSNLHESFSNPIVKFRRHSMRQCRDRGYGIAPSTFKATAQSVRIQKNDIGSPLFWTHRWFESGDEIFCILGCETGIVLRRTGVRYSVVGNVLAFGYYNGIELMQQQPDLSSITEDVYIY